MEPVTVVTLVTTLIPFLTKGAKKLFKTEKLSEQSRKGVNALIPVLIGVLSNGLYTYSLGNDWMTALAVGLGSGGAASSVRDIDKNLTRIVEGIGNLIKSKKKA